MTATVRSMLDDDLRALGMTQKDFGEKLGISQQAISQWCSRNTIPKRSRELVIQVLGPDARLSAALRDGALDGTAFQRDLDVLPSRPSVYPPTGQTHAFDSTLVQTGSRSTNSYALRALETQAIFRKLRDSSSIDPDSLQKTMKIGPITFRAGLVSNNLVVDYFSYTSVDMLALIGTKRLLNILTIKRADEIREHRRAYMLIALASSVVAPTHVDATKFDRVFGELELQCQLFGVSLLKAGSVDELVSCILAAQDDFYPEMSEADKALFSEYLDDLDGMP